MNYTAEELLRLSQFIKDMQSVLGGSRDDNDDDEARAWDDYEKASSALAAYAKRIEADESAVPVGYVMDDTATGHKFGLLTQDLPPNTKLFIHPPAQATQVEDEDMDAQLTVMIEHLTSIVESQAAEPVAQGEVVDCPECGTRCTHRAIPMSDDVIHEYTPISAQPRAAQNTAAKPAAQAAQLDGFFIHCDGVTVNVTEAYRQAGFDVLPPTVTLSALQILALAKRPANYGLFPYIGEHRAYGDNEAIILTPGMRFLAVPPATWGGAYSDPPNQQFMRGPAADKPAAEPAMQGDCHVCGCVDDGQCLCTRPHVVPVTQGEVFAQVLASLIAAVSLLRRGGRKAAPSDTMFASMLADYEKAIEAGRALLATQQPREPS